MKSKRSNIVLIGMPGSGKSSVGIALSKLLPLKFADTDSLIERSETRSLQDIVDISGHQVLRQIEAKVILNLDLEHHIVATGGSAVYCGDAMTHLRAMGIVVFLDIGLETMEQRIQNLKTRGLAKAPEQNLADLYEERLPLYREFAEISIEASELSIAQTCAIILEKLPNSRGDDVGNN